MYPFYRHFRPMSGIRLSCAFSPFNGFIPGVISERPDPFKDAFVKVLLALVKNNRTGITYKIRKAQKNRSFPDFFG